jgi:hypothetical protein
VGLEDVADLIADLELGFAAWRGADRLVSPAPDVRAAASRAAGADWLGGHSSLALRADVTASIFLSLPAFGRLSALPNEVREGENVTFDRAVTLSCATRPTLSDTLGPSLASRA